MKRITLSLLTAMLSIVMLSAQSREHALSLTTGPMRYHAKGLRIANGYRIGMAWQQSLGNRLYKVLSLGFGEDDGSYYQPERWLEQATARDLYVGMGLGVNVLAYGRHRLYAHATLGGNYLQGHETMTREVEQRPEQSTILISRLSAGGTATCGYSYQLVGPLGLSLEGEGMYLHDLGFTYSLRAGLSLRF